MKKLILIGLCALILLAGCRDRAEGINITVYNKSSLDSYISFENDMIKIYGLNCTQVNCSFDFCISCMDGDKPENFTRWFAERLR